MRRKMLFIYNPNAGRGRIRTKLSQILEIILKTEYEIVIYPTRQKMDAREIAKEYATNNKCDAIVCSGGDGTLNEVVGGLMEVGCSLPVGYIPSGTTNDFGYSLNIPKDMEKAAEIIVKGATLLCDVGSMNNSYFTYTAAFGLFTDVSYDTPQNFKNVLGRMAYILSGISKLHSVKVYHLRIEHEDEVVEDDFIYGMLANSNSIGGFRGITGSQVLLDDGLFELFLIRRPHNLVELSGIINDLMHNVITGKHIYYHRVHSVKIISECDMPWSLDGEYGGTTTEANIVIHKQAIPYICDRTELIESKEALQVSKE